MPELLYASGLTLAVATLIVSLLISPRFRELAIDRPNERSLHKAPTPRTGGLAILVGTTAAIWLGCTRDTLIVWGLAMTIGLVSFADDRWGLPIAARFATQISAAIAMAVLTLGTSSPTLLVLAVLSIVWMTNLYNFMDGADGLAGGMGASGFFAYSLAAFRGGHLAVAVLSACLVAGCLAFLRCNLPPAKIFMGDVGSTVLGFCAAALGFYGLRVGLWPLWFPALAFLPFIADATVTISRRALRREKIWQAHRQHYYQRLVLSGWSHRSLSRVAYALMAASSAAGLFTLRHAPALGWAALATCSALLSCLMLAVDVRWSRYKRETGT
jgi:UDP-GlcNAc:undecaprenyl-phosphate/decaprenyl-phosphate GlcNAc-1-phosphate transferase